ncbi:MAG: MFS transporter, partial [Acidobacteriota bacterium]|nr:MFS transporter [Acidobacteriota bacterium]
MPPRYNPQIATHSRTRILVLLSLLAVITYLDRVCIAVAGPRMQDTLHISPAGWGWVTSVFFLSYSLFEIPTGMLGDRIGARRVLTRIVVWWSAFTALTGAFSSYGVLLAVRLLFGIGEAGAYPNINVVIGRWFSAERRGRAWGLVFGTSQLGGALSPLIVVPIQAHYGWRAPFFVLGAIGIVWAAVWFSTYRDSPAGESAPNHLLPWRAAVRSAPLWQISAIAVCYLYVMAFFWSWLQTYLVKGRGYSEAALLLSSLPYLVGAGAAFSGGFVSDWLVLRFGLKTGRRALGFAGLGSAALFMTAAVFTRDNLWALVFLTFSYTGILLQQPNVGAVVLDIGRRNAGAVFGVMNTAANLSSSVSAAVFGVLVQRFG